MTAEAETLTEPERFEEEAAVAGAETEAGAENKAEAKAEA